MKNIKIYVTTTYACGNCGGSVFLGDEFFVLKERGEVLPHCPSCNEIAGHMDAAVEEPYVPVSAMLSGRSGRL